jgi:cytochrome c oxidase subunit IV
VKRHPLDLFALVAGLAFVTIALLYLLDSAGVLSVDGRLVIPLVLIALGVGGLGGALLRMTRGGPAADPEPGSRPDDDL